jgi:farnesyl-diphosphate farnesyltransferase
MIRPADPGSLLRDHARTFSLTLRLLPRALREPLGIAYLLARASDTIADAAAIPMDRKLELLGELEALLADGGSQSWNPGTDRGFSPAEAVLMDSVPDLLRALETLSDRDSICSLWRTILRGQLFDLKRFEHGAEPLSAQELDRYCGLVAGSVGEFWTRLIKKHRPGVLSHPVERMVSLGIAYGKGLQLVNILRDRRADLLLGRRYVQDADLPELFDLAEEWLRSGNCYLAGLRPGRILMGSSLPHDLAVLTLAEIRRFPENQRVRIRRRAVRSVLVRNVTSLCFPRGCDPAS